MSRCVNCSLLLSHPLPNRQMREATAAMVNLLKIWISTTVSGDDIICQECYTILERESANFLRGIVPTQTFGHEQVCLSCGKSILRSPTHKVGLNNPERNFILTHIPSYQVHRLERVCLRCWSNAYRSVRRQAELDQNRQAIKNESAIATIDNMEIPSTSRGNVVEISTSQVEVTSAPPPPPPLPSTPSYPISQAVVHSPKIISHIYKRAAASSRHCIFNDCYCEERLLVPSAIKEMLLMQHRLYVPRSARICSHHLRDGAWNELSFDYNDFTGLQMDDMMLIMERGSRRHFDFSNVRLMDPHLLNYFIGMNADSFHQLLLHIPSLAQEVPCASTALSIMLVKLRTGDSNERLSSLFRLSRSTLERYMSHARNCLSETFCPSLLSIRSYVNSK